MTSRFERSQVLQGPVQSLSGGWTELTILSKDPAGQLSSKTEVRSKNEDAFFDVSIEEYTGMSRRAKCTSMRFEETAARALYEILTKKFGNSAESAKQKSATD